QENALFVGNNNVKQAVAIHVHDGELGADTRIVVNLVRNKAGNAVAVALGLEPIEVGGIARRGIALGTVRPPAPAGHKVFEAVAVDIDAVQGVGLSRQRKSAAVAEYQGAGIRSIVRAVK